ncbi:metallophosphoesterase family protein [Algicella marina]|uniref:Metallophosphoesterase n=1 Tax=Algicella marina TaxID=2683284 RepID=A0A6P1T1N8_9RHOB|nr:metallophosphoesterase family protein [Algicella marina]QHQ35199.1 metallophosphoesterase [Algicella marina]
MEVRDLGVLEGPVLLFGGPYSNLQALEALLAEAGRLGIPPERCICTGDLVAYCADPVAVAEQVRDLELPVVQGNCEVQLAAGASDCGCGFGENSVCDLLSRGWYAAADAAVGPELRQWMGGLPGRLVFTHAGRRWAVIHGGASQISRFLWAVSDAVDLADELATLEAEIGAVDGVIAGHCGIGFVREIGRHIWVNAGVIGMPPHDGLCETEFAVLDDDGVHLQRLAYDHGAAAAAMREAGLVQGYERALESGWWPSEDVLPMALRRR